MDATGGEPQRIYRGDAVQPRVSPNGRRIAFWAMPPNEDFTSFASPNRDVWTVAVDGTDPVRVTTDEATDWNPVWSPDGTALYFLSNRSGSMNLWRVGIDETTGATTGEAQALTAPTSYVRHFSLSADGRLGTYANWATTNNLARIRIDARAAVTRGPIEAITTGPRDFLTFDVNDDGQVVLMTNVAQQEDLLIAAAGSGLRHLVNDRYRDRNPRWAADGRQIFFYSDRGQNYELYSIDRDGGGLRQLTDTGGKRFYPVPSRDGSKVLAADITSYELFVYDARDFSKAPDRLPPLPPELRGASFVPLDWSPDGRSVSGLSGPNIWVYSFETRAYRRVGTRSRSLHSAPRSGSPRSGSPTDAGSSSTDRAGCMPSTSRPAPNARCSPSTARSSARLASALTGTGSTSCTAARAATSGRCASTTIRRRRANNVAVTRVQRRPRTLPVRGRPRPGGRSRATSGTRHTRCRASPRRTWHGRGPPARR